MTTSTGLRRGDRDYRRAVLAMLAAGLATFNALYATQALLPILVADLDVTPTGAALTVSATTGMLAVCIVPMSILSERFGRGRILVISALAATAAGLLVPLAPTAAALIALRGLQGIAVAGVPAVAMTWLAEEVNPLDLGRAMGVYIAGTTVGGLTGRLIPAGLLEIMDWRTALLITSAVALLTAVAMSVLLPRQKNFTPRHIGPRTEFSAMVGHLRNPQLLGLFLIAFVGMGVFVSLYNYLGFRMIDHFGLSPALVGVVFLMYLSGTWSSARAGALAERYGRGTVLAGGAVLMWAGLLSTAADRLVPALLGLFLFTAAFFAMHSTASSWIGLAAPDHRAEASSMYLFSYYAGSSLVGAATGAVFMGLSWSRFVLVLAVILTLAVGVSLALRSRETA